MTSTMPAIKMLHCLFCFLRQSDLEFAMVKDALELPHLPISTSEGLGLQVCTTAFYAVLGMDPELPAC